MTTYNFPITSRYYGTQTLTMEGPDGRQVIYLARRFLPQPERFSLLKEHVVAQGERLDQITAKYLGDPTAFWRVADANAAMRVEALTETVGKRLRITLPEGVPGLPDAGLINA